MKHEALAAFMKEHEAGLSADVARRMNGHQRMAAIAAGRELSAVDMSTQVAGFFLKAMSSDLELGIDAAVREGILWSQRMAAGNDLEFPAEFYAEVVEAVFSALAGSEALPADLVPAVGEYRGHVHGLLSSLMGGAS